MEFLNSRSPDPEAVRRLLLAALEDARDPSRLVKNASAVDALGIETHPMSADACRWCTFGLVFKHDPQATEDLGFGPIGDQAFDELNNAALKLGYSAPGKQNPAVYLNDTASPADVVKMFELAVQSCTPSAQQAAADQ